MKLYFEPEFYKLSPIEYVAFLCERRRKANLSAEEAAKAHEPFEEIQELPLDVLSIDPKSTDLQSLSTNSDSPYPPQNEDKYKRS